MSQAPSWTQRLSTTVLALRGYNTTNLGRTPELLAHGEYGPIVARYLRNYSQLAADVLKRPVDLIERVRRQQETQGLDTYAEDAAMIVAVEQAQLEILEAIHGVHWRACRMAFGYSLGEPSALIAAGVFKAEDLMPPSLALSDDVCELAADVTMGVVFCRRRELNVQDIERLCLEITAQGKGVLAIQSILAPNAVLLLGQQYTVDEFRHQMKDVLPEETHVRINPHRWPPLHTPIIWQRNIANRAALRMQTASGGFTAPVPAVFSCVTGKANYNDYNAREILNRWVDHPQRLWDAVYETLAQGSETVVHVGPDPNLILATFRRLAENVQAQLAGRSWSNYGMRAMSFLARRRQWLANLLSTRSALLRAPFVEHIVLEDWLLGPKPDEAK